jgi:SAM-dependent methyltransferase
MNAPANLNLGKKFGQIADTYDSFRPDYPSEVFSRTLAAAAPPRKLLVDLGVGTGKMARGFIGSFDEIIGVEPDPAMAAKLRELEPRIRVRFDTAEEVVFAPASVDLTTIGHALHWMDPAIVLSRVTEWLRPSGIFAICGGGFCAPAGPVGELVQREFDERWADFRDPRTKKQFPEDILRSEPRMAVLESATVPDVRHLTAAQYTGYCRSTSHGNAYARTLADPDAYWRELESRIRTAASGDTLEIDFSRFLMLLKKIA